MKTKIPPPIQTMIAALLMWWLTPAYTEKFLNNELMWVMILLFVVAGVFVLLSAVLGFSKHKTTVNPLKPEQASTLVIEGIFNYTRNPMYLGMASLLIAWMCWLQNPIAMIVFVIFVIYITIFQIKPEEEALIKLFGDQFLQYCSKVRRWL